MGHYFNNSQTHSPRPSKVPLALRRGLGVRLLKLNLLFLAILLIGVSLHEVVKFGLVG